MIEANRIESSQFKTCNMCYEDKPASTLFNICINKHDGQCAPCLSNWYKSQDLRECTICREKLKIGKITEFNSAVDKAYIIEISPQRRTQQRRTVINENTVRPRLTGLNAPRNSVFDDDDEFLSS
ncbi:MAG: hypothetical protein VX185_12155 [Pseudomonadota bacterium]|nr:hypothetical protein [Pseudomonadota bacterium]